MTNEVFVNNDSIVCLLGPCCRAPPPLQMESVSCRQPTTSALKGFYDVGHDPEPIHCSQLNYNADKKAGRYQSVAAAMMNNEPRE